MQGTTTSRLVAAAVATGLLLAGSSALAGPGGRAGRQGAPGPGLRAALATLDLTDTQKEELKKAFEAERPKYDTLRQEGRAAREALRVAAESPNPDPATVGKAFLQVRAHREATKAARQESRKRLEALLTPEQRAKLEGWMEAHRQARRGPGLGLGRNTRRGPNPPVG